LQGEGHTMEHDRQSDVGQAEGGRLAADRAVDAAGLVRYAAGSIVSRTLVDSAAGSVTLFAFDAGQGLSEHTVPFDAVVLLLDGRAELVIGGKELSVGAGELAIMPANVPHAVKSSGRFKMMLSMLKH